jgi:hypothetical protein
MERDYQEGAFRLVSRNGHEIYASGSYRLCERLRATKLDALIQVCVELQDDGREQGWIACTT